ncbi:ig(immunoglobulin) and lrr(leucine rich repeat) domain [Holotrichia oblita]|uniref:Ig(Immunoglobulin) and lrr(Leucine rich repeat) domain n=1 Tax=Holotrichia oblita TaxID=644536 RepID=A0ACB9TD51_HOLOL|nr:ig(immunoglobulin) and lrr(leucine rich repeat) domain [Holotrichia oblita]
MAGRGGIARHWIVEEEEILGINHIREEKVEAKNLTLYKNKCSDPGYIGIVSPMCSHSDLPRVLAGLRTIGKTIFQPIDELILENNNLPSLSGRTFFPLRAVRLMLRYNGLERVSSSWLAGLEQTLMELYVVEPDLKSLPEESLNHMATLEAITIQSNMLKRLPSFSNLPQLNYVQIESSSLTELTPRYFKNLPRLEKIQINGSPLLTRLELDQFQDLPSLKVINISYSGLNWIHPRGLNHLPGLTGLSLIGNKITDSTMIGRALRDLPNLDNLRLDYNAIERIDASAFTDLPALKSISISYNRIMEVHGGAFYRLPALKIINLNHNMIRHVHPESISVTNLEELLLVNNEIGHAAELRSILDSLPRLTLLDMSYNDLHIIPFGLLRGHPTLEQLNLNYNKIDIIEREALIGMPALRELSLKNNTLSDNLRMPMWHLPNLKGLDLSNNFFRRIEPGLLTNLPSLRRVDFSSNKLDQVNPLALLDTPALEYINLSSNALVALHPATFRHLIGLYELDVSNNRLLQFIPGLPKRIEYLHLKKNNIGNIPLTTSPDLDLSTLRMLDVSSNSLKNLKTDSFRTLPLLKKLYLGNNFLQNLEDGTFDGLLNLEVLDLQGNNLVQIPSRIFNELPELQAINLRDNKLYMIKHQIFHNNKHLKMIDISTNQLRDLHKDIFYHSRELEVINASHNHLVNVPSSVNGLERLKVLDLHDNRLSEIDPDLLNSLKSLTELRVSENFIQELKTAAFDEMEHLKVLYLNNNELSDVQTNTFRALPGLKHIKLNDNKVKVLPEFAFNNLPNLQVLELQDNLIQKISENSFYLVPHLLMLNLSGNLLPDMNQAGLQNLQSLEMLDVSFNRLTEVENGALDKMEWLVELKMDNNAICGVRSISFNRMPRLRVLSMKNNKMMSFPERAVQKLRGNLAVLDIDGNPLACTCSLLWLRAWLQESSSTGPKCMDGSLLTEKRLSREECMQESRLLDPVAPGCESELLSVLNPYDSPHFHHPWMNLRRNSTSGKTNSLPSPEESELFYDDYLDYPYNDTDHNHGGHTHIKASSTEKSSHFISGDTPTLYAASSKKNTTVNTPKPVNGSPSTSGFTIFGVPLSSFNINNLWSNGRNEKKEDEAGSVKANIVTKPLKVNEVTDKVKQKLVMPEQNVERKNGVVNKSIRGTSSRGMFPLSDPEIQTGGFIPLLPGSGGFTPIANPAIRPITEVQIEKVDVKLLNTSINGPKVLTTIPPKHYTSSYMTNKTSNMGHPLPFPTTALPTTTQIPNKHKIETKLFVQPPPKIDSKPQNTGKIIVEATSIKKTNLKPQEIAQIKNISEYLSTTTPISFKSEINHSDIELLEDGQSFEDIFKEIVENVSLPLNLTIGGDLELHNPVKKTHLSDLNINLNASSSGNNAIIKRQNNFTKPAFLIPGGQQPQYKPSGRSTITKIASPHVSSSAPLLSNVDTSEEITPLPHHKDQEISTTAKSTIDKSWYFASYNQSTLQQPAKMGNPYYNCGVCRKYKVYLIMLLYVVKFYVC